MNKSKKSIILFIFIFIFLSPILFTNFSVDNLSPINNPKLSEWERGGGNLGQYNNTIEECDDLQETIYYNFTSSLIDPTNCSHIYDAGFLETEFKDGTWGSPDNDNITMQDLINYNDYIAGFEDFYAIVGNLSIWVNLSLTECNDGLFSTFYSTEVEHYPATFSFTNDTIGGNPANFSVYEGGGTINVIETLDGHDMVVELHDNVAADNVELTQYFSENRTCGVIEFWMRTDDATDECRFYLYDSGVILLIFAIRDDDFDYWDGGWNDVIGSPVPADDTWYHIKIIFECSLYGYEGLEQYDWRVFINEIEYGDYNFANNQPQADWAVWCTDDVVDASYYYYVDAIGYSWLDDYDIGDNYYWSYYPATHDFENYNTTLSGNYYGTFSFEEDLVGSNPAGWVVDETGGTVNVISNLGGHNKVVELHDTDAVNEVSIIQSFSEQITGSIELWIRADDVTTKRTFIYGNTGNNWIVFMDEDKWQFQDGAAVRDVGLAAVADVWYHVKINFDCDTDTYDIIINGIEYQSGADFFAVTTGINKLYIGSRGNDLDYKIYFDAVGFSWDLSYNQIEDTWNFPNDYKSWNKNPYNLTDLFRDNWDYYGTLGGSYSVDGEFANHKKYLEIYDDSDTGFYRALYSFEDDLVGTTGVAIGFIDVDLSGAGCTASIVSDIGGHRKVLELYDNGNPTRIEVYDNFDSGQTYGTFESWTRSGDASFENQIELYKDAIILNSFRIFVDKFQFYDGVWQDVGLAAADNTWYHIRIDFECTVGGYMGLAQYDWQVFINGVHYGDYDFVNNDVPNRIRLRTGAIPVGYYVYWDAFQYSWDSLNYIFDYHDDSDNSVAIGTQVWNTFEENQTECCLSFWTRGDFDDAHGYFRIYLMQDIDFITSIKINTSELYYLNNKTWCLGNDTVSNYWHYIRICFNTTADTYDLYFDYNDYTYGDHGITFNLTLVASDIPFQQTATGIDRIMFETCYSASPTFYKVDALQYGWDLDSPCNEYWDCGLYKWDVNEGVGSIVIEDFFAGYVNVLNMTDNGGTPDPDFHRHIDDTTDGWISFDVYIDGATFGGTDSFIFELWHRPTSREFSLQFRAGVINTFWTSTGETYLYDTWINVDIAWNSTYYMLYINNSLVEIASLAVGDPINYINFETMYCTDDYDSIYLDNIRASFWVDCDVYNLIPINYVGSDTNGYAELDFKVALHVGEDLDYLASCLYWAFLTDSNEYVNFTWYNFVNDTWDVIIRDYFDDNVPPVGFTEYYNCSGCFNSTWLDPYINSSGHVLFRIKILDLNEEFEFYFDELRIFIVGYVQPELEKVFCWRGIWRYRWWLRVGWSSIWMFSNWTYFEVIPLFEGANFEGVSESPYSTYWKLISSDTIIHTRFSDDMSAGTWDLYGAGSRTFVKTYAESSNYLLDNSTCNIGDYTGTHFDVGTEETQPEGITWDGTHFWVVGTIADKAFQYTAAGVYTGINFDLVGSWFSGITWDGTYFWVVCYFNDEVYKYTAAGVYTGIHFDVGAQDAIPYGITWDGTHLWVVGYDTEEIYQYTVAGVYTTVHFDVNTEDSQPTGIVWDSTHFWVVGNWHDEVYQYTAAGVYTGTHFDVGTEDGHPRGFGWDGSYFYVVGDDNNEVYQYTYDYIISKYYHGGGHIYIQTNITETLTFKNVPYGADVDVEEGDFMYFHIRSTTQNVKVKFYDDGVEQVEYTLLENNVNFNPQTILLIIDSDFTFDSIGFIGIEMNDAEYFMCYGYEVYSYIARGDLYELYIDPDGKDSLMAQFGNYELEIYDRDSGSFSLKERMNITLTEDLLTIIYVQTRTYYLKIYHYAQELSTIIITGAENRTLTAGRDEILELLLQEGDYVVNWTNGENGEESIHSVALYSDQSLIFETTYYSVYFSLFDQYSRRVDDTLFSFYLNGSRKDFGFVELHSRDYSITVYDYLNVTVFNQIVTLETYTEYNIIIRVFELEIRHLGYENSNITLFETTTHNHINFSMSPDSARRFVLADSTYNLTWTNGENMFSTTFDIILNENYILTLNSSYFQIYFSVFNFDGLGLEPHLFRFYINGLRRDFGFNTLKQDINTLKVSDFFNQTLFNSAINLRQYTEYNIFIEVWTMHICNNYSYPIKMEIERNDIEVEQVIPAGLSFDYRMLPNVEYVLKAYHLNGTLLETKKIELDENNKVVSFGFFEIEVPYDPEPLVFDFTVLIAFIVIICVIMVIIVISWAYMKKDRDEMIENPKVKYSKKKNKKKKIGTFDHSL